MFVQIIKGTTTDPSGLQKRFEQWRDELQAQAGGWRGTTAGVADDGRFVAVVEFESEDAARANSDRPEQGEWWTETERLIDGPEFVDTTDVDTWLGGPDRSARFVQVIEGRVADREAMERLRGAEVETELQQARPDVTGGLVALHGDRFTQVVYFSDEQAAREGEARAAEQGDNGAGGDWDVAFADLSYTDLRDPWLDGA